MYIEEEEEEEISPRLERLKVGDSYDTLRGNFSRKRCHDTTQREVPLPHKVGQFLPYIESFLPSSKDLFKNNSAMEVEEEEKDVVREPYRSLSVEESERMEEDLLQQSIKFLRSCPNV